MFANTVRRNAGNSVTLKRNKPIPPVEQSNKNKTLFKTIVGDAPRARVGENQGEFQPRTTVTAWTHADRKFEARKGIKKYQEDPLYKKLMIKFGDSGKKKKETPAEFWARANAVSKAAAARKYKSKYDLDTKQGQFEYTAAAPAKSFSLADQAQFGDTFDSKKYDPDPGATEAKRIEAQARRDQLDREMRQWNTVKGSGKGKGRKKKKKGPHNCKPNCICRVRRRKYG